MGKNILVLTGSPRKNGNSNALADAFIRGAAQKGHELHRFDTAVRRIQPCLACERCFSAGRACIVDDDFNEIAGLVEKAEVLVFVTPNYWFGISTYLKIAWDKFHAFIRPEHRYKLTENKESVYIICGRNPDPENYRAPVFTYETISSRLGWKNRGVIVAAGFFEAGTVAGRPCLAEAEKLGVSI
jgi:multimeric flavodoxin WrbA